MADLDQRMITEAFKDALRWGRSEGIFGGSGGGGGGGGGGPSPSPASSGIVDGLKKEAGAVGGAFVAVGKAGVDVAEKLLSGGARVSDYTKALRDNFSTLGAGGTVLGKTFSTAAGLLDKLGDNLDQNIDTWRRLSDTGASFGNDIISMKEQAANARMTIGEMSEVVQKNTTTLAGLGPTVSQSMAAFSKVSKEMYDSGAGEQLRQMGYTTKDLNDVLAVSLSNRRITDLKDEASRKKAYESAASLATEMDAVAKITGQSKQQQLDELRRREADGQRQAAIDSAIAKGGANAKSAFDLLETTSKSGGQTFQKLAQDIAAMKRPSEGMEEAYAALGPETQKLLQKAGEAARAGNEADAKRYTEMALEARANFQKTETYRTLAAQGLKTFSDQYGEGGAFRKSMDAAGGSVAGLKKNVEDAQKGLEVDPTTGERISKDSTKAITEFAVNVENRGRDLTKVLTNEVIKPLADPVGRQLKAFNVQLNDPKKVLELEAGMKTGRVKYQANDAVQEGVRAEGGIREKDKAYPELVKLTQLLGSEATKDKTNAKLDSIANAQGKSVKEVIDAAMANKGAGLADLNKQLAANLSAEEIKKSQTEKADAEKRNKTGPQGSAVLDYAKSGKDVRLSESVGAGVGALGKLFTPSEPGFVTVTNMQAHAEGGYVPKPTISTLAEKGPEFVLNQPQMKSLIDSVGQKGMQGIDISKISKDISTSVSSISKNTTLPFDEFAGVDEAIKKQQTPFDEFAGLDEAIKRQQEGSKSNLANISFGPNGLPVFKQAEAARQNLDNQKGAEEKARAVTAKAAESQPKEDSKSVTATTKSSSLDDVVKQLNQLNKLMSQFVDDHRDLGTKQIRAAKSSSANINERI